MCAVLAAVVFLDESFSVVNGVGLGVLIAGVALFNWTKYRKMATGQAKGARLPYYHSQNRKNCQCVVGVGTLHVKHEQA